MKIITARLFSLRRGDDLAFAFLVGVTTILWWLLDSRNNGAGDTVLLASVSVALVKASIVTFQFMEVRHAPVVLQGFMVGWLGLVAAGITYLGFNSL